MIGRQPIVHSVAVVVKTLDRLDRQWSTIVLRSAAGLLQARYPSSVFTSKFGSVGNDPLTINENVLCEILV